MKTIQAVYTVVALAHSYHGDLTAVLETKDEHGTTHRLTVELEESPEANGLVAHTSQVKVSIELPDAPAKPVAPKAEVPKAAAKKKAAAPKKKKADKAPAPEAPKAPETDATTK